MTISCIAVDDEPLALKQIVAYVQKTPFLNLIAACNSAFEAMEVLRNQEAQLMFVDISMPDLSGMEFVKSLAQKPYIVFTTAYSEYAVEGFKVDAVDYLLKPISYTEFLKAANKVKDRLDLVMPPSEDSFRTSADYLFVKSDYKLMRIDFADIKYVEGMHEYVRIHLTDAKPIMTLVRIKSLEEQLPPNSFMRVHRSYIVNLSKIKVIERNRIVFDSDVYIPVSEQYKAKFQEYIDKNFI